MVEEWKTGDRGTFKFSNDAKISKKRYLLIGRLYSKIHRPMLFLVSVTQAKYILAFSTLASFDRNICLKGYHVRDHSSFNVPYGKYWNSIHSYSLSDASEVVGDISCKRRTRFFSQNNENESSGGSSFSTSGIEEYDDKGFSRIGGGGKARFVGMGRGRIDDFLNMGSSMGMDNSRGNVPDPIGFGFGFTTLIDAVLRIVLSDVGNIIIGSIALIICLVNRVSYTDSLLSSGDAALASNSALMGEQSRADLLAVFASMAVLLNGVSKLDVTSALAETVELNGIDLGPGKVEWIAYNRVEENLILSPITANRDNETPFLARSSSAGTAAPRMTPSDKDQYRKRRQMIEWALQSVLDSTPANTAVLMVNSKQSQLAIQETGAISSWLPAAFAGIVPTEPLLRCVLPKMTRTPILDRFLSYEADDRKESYLPTLQALPGKVEFTYLPPNTQSALIVPIQLAGYSTPAPLRDEIPNILLVLGGDTAKNFTPRDIAWIQVIAARLQETCFVE